MNKKKDSRFFEIKKTYKQAEDYDQKLSGWEVIHKYLVSGEWGKSYDGIFLDYGCGTGLVSRNIINLDKIIVGVDISKSMCAITNKKYKIPIVIGDCLNLPFKNNAFSTICVSGILHHIPDKLENAFNELTRCSNKTLCIIESSNNVSIPMRFILYMNRIYSYIIKNTINKSKDKYHGTPYEKNLNPKELINLLVKNNFKIKKFRYFNYIPHLHNIIKNNTKFENIIKALISDSSGTDVEIIAEKI